MPVPPFVAGQILTAAQLNTGAYRVASATAAATATTLTVNNAFTTTYRHYRIYISGYSATAGNLTFQLTSSGTAAATSYYYNRTVLSYTVANVTAQGSNTTNVLVGQLNNGALAATSNLVIDVLDPYQIGTTGIFAANNYNTANAGTVYGGHLAAASYDGFRLTGAGNLTLNVSIYGLVGA